MQNRVYYFDTHISDIILRLLVVFVFVSFFTLAIQGLLKPDLILDKVFIKKIFVDASMIFGKKTDKTGYSKESFFQKIYNEIQKDQKSLLNFEEYSLKYISDKDEDLILFKKVLREYRIEVMAISLFFLIISLILFGLIKLIYGNGNYRFKIFQKIFLFFNNEFNERCEKIYAGDFTPLQKKIFDICFYFSKGNKKGEFEFDGEKFFKILYPLEDNVQKDNLNKILLAFKELTTSYYNCYFRLNRILLKRKFCPIQVIPSQYKQKEIFTESNEICKVYKSGVFKIAVPLYENILKHRYLNLPHEMIFSIKEEHYLGYLIYLCLWEHKQEMLKDPSFQSQKGNFIFVSFYDLLYESAIFIENDYQKEKLIQLHKDLDYLLDEGFFKEWHIRDVDKVKKDWIFKENIFVYNAKENTYDFNKKLLMEKVYYFQLAEKDELNEIYRKSQICQAIDGKGSCCDSVVLRGFNFCRKHLRQYTFDSSEEAQQNQKLEYHGKTKDDSVIILPDNNSKEDRESSYDDFNLQTKEELISQKDQKEAETEILQETETEIDINDEENFSLEEKQDNEINEEIPDENYKDLESIEQQEHSVNKNEKKQNLDILLLQKKLKK
jgi:hypothetical protein